MRYIQSLYCIHLGSHTHVHPTTPIQPTSSLVQDLSHPEVANLSRQDPTQIQSLKVTVPMIYQMQERLDSPSLI